MKVLYFCKYCKQDYENPIYDGPILVDYCRDCEEKVVTQKEENYE